MPTVTISLLAIEDNPGDARLLRESLRDIAANPYEVDVVDTLAGGLDRLGRRGYAAVLLDLGLPDSSGLDTLLAVRRQAPSTPVVVLTGLEDERVAHETLKAGAQDYLVKGQFDAVLLDRCLRYAIERHHADERSKRSAALLQATLDATVDGILAVGHDGTILSSNKRLSEMLHVPPAALETGVESAFLDLVRHQVKDRDRYQARLHEITALRDAESYDVLEFADGRVYERYSTPQIAEDRVVGRVWSFHDVTERKQAVDELRVAMRAAEAENRAKSDFVASLSHEIRTPLNTILGMADLLAEMPLGEEQREYVEILRRSGDLMRALVSDVLDLSKIESGRLELERAEFSLRELTEGVLSMASRTAGQKPVALTLDLDEALADRWIGDPTRLRQILFNLLTNAVKFTEKGTVRLKVERLTEGADAGSLLFQVADTGCGIPADRLESVFERFIQADVSVSRRHGGTGLGLAICRRLVRLMGGRISVESEVGKGSTFSVVVELEAMLAKRSAPPLGGLEGARILVVSGAGDRDALSAALCEAGAVVDEADDAVQALAVVEEASSPGAFAVFIVDARLAPRGGFALLEDLRPLVPSFERVLMLLPQSHRKDDVVRLATVGVGGYFVRPLDLGGIVSASATLATRHRGSGASTAAASPQLPRLLVVDDSEDNRRLVQIYLRGTPCEIDLAENGEEGVRIFMSKPFDLVLMDLQMPALDGLSATQALRRWEGSQGRRPTPIVAVSALVQPEDLQRSIAAGCNAYLTKPVRRERLLEVVQEYAVRRGDA